MGVLAIAQQSIAAEALRRAARPPGSDPAGVAVALGFRPRALVTAAHRPGKSGELVYRWAHDPQERARGIWLALAHALLSRAIGPHDIAAAERLADALAAQHETR